MAHFKQCPKCRAVWSSRRAFLDDPEAILVGYQVNFKDLDAGYLLFNHHCRTTLALPVLAFRDLYDGPVFAERATGGEACLGHCLQQGNLEMCPARCECAFVRHILRLIRNWPRYGRKSVPSSTE